MVVTPVERIMEANLFRAKLKSYPSTFVGRIKEQSDGSDNGSNARGTHYGSSPYSGQVKILAEWNKALSLDFNLTRNKLASVMRLYAEHNRCRIRRFAP